MNTKTVNNYKGRKKRNVLNIEGSITTIPPEPYINPAMRQSYPITAHRTTPKTIYTDKTDFKQSMDKSFAATALKRLSDLAKPADFRLFCCQSRSLTGAAISRELHMRDVVFPSLSYTAWTPG